MCNKNKVNNKHYNKNQYDRILEKDFNSVVVLNNLKNLDVLNEIDS